VAHKKYITIYMRLPPIIACTTDQEVGGSNPPERAIKIKYLAANSTILNTNLRPWDTHGTISFPQN